jgi:hypothetical protein
MATHTVPITPCPYGTPGHFASAAIIRVVGAENGAAGYGIGGWEVSGAGRIVSGGPRVAGPHAYLYGLASVLDCRGINADAGAAGLLFHVAAGDTLQVGDLVFEVRLDSRRYPILTAIK